LQTWASKSLPYKFVTRISEDPAPIEGKQVFAESPDTAEIFAGAVHDYAHHREGRQVCLLEAGCGRIVGDLGVERLRAAGFDIRVTGVDHDHPLTRGVAEARSDLESFTLDDLRTVALPPRSFDIVHCAGLLERIRHVELVLDRFVAALRPGGLLLLRTADRECAAGIVDRFAAALPGRVRELAWRRLRPGEPGPYPAVYEEIVSGPGIRGYATMRGLVIAERQANHSDLTGPGACWRVLDAARRLAAGASRGRYTDAHDELLFVIRKPEDRFLRVL
jgi:SAM-dependent methyltransferase